MCFLALSTALLAKGHYEKLRLANGSIGINLKKLLINSQIVCSINMNHMVGLCKYLVTFI